MTIAHSESMGMPALLPPNEAQVGTVTVICIRGDRPAKCQCSSSQVRKISYRYTGSIQDVSHERRCG